MLSLIGILLAGMNGIPMKMGGIGKMLDMNIPITQWETYFLCQKFRTLHIIRPSQNPVVESYK